jgi:hypothetical protein
MELGAGDDRTKGHYSGSHVTGYSGRVIAVDAHDETGGISVSALSEAEEVLVGVDQHALGDRAFTDPLDRGAQTSSLPGRRHGTSSEATPSAGIQPWRPAHGASLSGGLRSGG